MEALIQDALELQRVQKLFYKETVVGKFEQGAQRVTCPYMLEKDHTRECDCPSLRPIALARLNVAHCMETHGCPVRILLGYMPNTIAGMK